MDPFRRKQSEKRLEEIKAELAAITETRVIPEVNLPDYEDRLWDELDALEFDLSVKHLQDIPCGPEQNTIGPNSMSSDLTHQCQLCGKEVTGDSIALPAGWRYISFSTTPSGENVAILCDLCSTKSAAAVWILARQRQEPKQIMN